MRQAASPSRELSGKQSPLLTPLLQRHQPKILSGNTLQSQLFPFLFAKSGDHLAQDERDAPSPASEPTQEVQGETDSDHHMAGQLALN